MLAAIEPETEADPAGILLGWLTCLGSAIGRGAWVTVGADVHFPALFTAIVGRTSDAKGVSWGVAQWPFRLADSAWAEAAICNGVGSGPGLIERVRDERRSIKPGKDGSLKETVVPGAADKRCLLRLDELAVCFKLQRGENSTLGETLLTAWGGGRLEVPNRSDNALSATGYSVSAIGDTQPGTLARLLASGKGAEAVNGWLNRFLWACVRSPRSLPSGGNIDVLTPFVGRMAEVLAFAKGAGAVKRDAEAEALWAEVYPGLKASGDAVPHTDRARPYVVRLSLLYALADRSPVIRAEHLRAALAVWAYCRASAAMLFGTASASALALPPATASAVARGEAAAEAEATAVANAGPLPGRLLAAIQAEPGRTRTDLWAVVGHRVRAEELTGALAFLQATWQAHSRAEGRAERWYPGPGGGDGPRPTADPPGPVFMLPPLDEGETPPSPLAVHGVAKGSGPTAGAEAVMGIPIAGAGSMGIPMNPSAPANLPHSTTFHLPPATANNAQRGRGGVSPSASAAADGPGSLALSLGPEPPPMTEAAFFAGLAAAEAPAEARPPPIRPAIPPFTDLGPADIARAVAETVAVLSTRHTERERAWAERYVRAQAEAEGRRRADAEADPPMSDAEFWAALRPSPTHSAPDEDGRRPLSG